MHSSSGSLCAKVGKIRKLLQNWEFMALQTREDWAKNDGSTAECRSIVTAWKSLFYKGISLCIPRGKYPFFGFAIAMSSA